MKSNCALIVISLALAACPRAALSLAAQAPTAQAQTWTKESKDRANRAALHDAVQLVRGDSGKWSDEPHLQPAPPIKQKPAKLPRDIAGVAQAKSSRPFVPMMLNLGPSSTTQVVPSSFKRNTLPL